MVAVWGTFDKTSHSSEFGCNMKHFCIKRRTTTGSVQCPWRALQRPRYRITYMASTSLTPSCVSRFVAYATICDAWTAMDRFPVVCMLIMCSGSSYYTFNFLQVSAERAYWYQNPCYLSRYQESASIYCTLSAETRKMSCLMCGFEVLESRRASRFVSRYPSP